jgi:hypothetical protein
MAKSGLPRIDGLFESTLGVQPVGPGDPDRASIGAIQDLLRGQRQPSMPTPVATGMGSSVPRPRQRLSPSGVRTDGRLRQ